MNKSAITLLAVLLSSSAYGQKYQVIDLGDLGGASIGAYDVNRNGTVVGAASGPSSIDASGNATQQFSYHAFSWQDGVMQDMGALDGDISYATAINSLGVVVGYSYEITTPATDDEAAVTTQRAVYLAPGEYAFTSLPWPEQDSTAMRALDIDESNVVVGYVTTLIDEETYQSRGFVWRPDSNFTEVAGALETGGSSVLNAVNASRQQAVGYASLDGSVRAIRLDLVEPNTLIEIGTLGGSSSQASGINDEGVVVGWAATANDASTAGFYLPVGHSMLQSIGQLDEDFSYSKANDINNSGVLVGAAQASTGTTIYHAVLYDTKADVPHLIDLNDQIDCITDANMRWVLTEATAISDAGHIIGYGSRGSAVRAFLLLPVDDSAVATCKDVEAAAFEDNSGSGSTPMIAMALFAVLAWRRRLGRR